MWRPSIRPPCTMTYIVYVARSYLVGLGRGYWEFLVRYSGAIEWWDIEPLERMCKISLLGQVRGTVLGIRRS